MTPRDVESIVAGHPDVWQCAVVTTMTDQSAAPTLVVHYVVRPTAKLGVAELRDYLRQLLPVDLMPRALRRHAIFPPSRNGTLDLELMRGRAS